MPPLRAVAVTVTLLLCAASCSATRGEPPAAARQEGLHLAYDVVFEGLYGQLEARMRDVSQLVAKQGEPPATVQGLRRRAQADRDLFLRLLRSRGYYDGRIDWDVDSSKTPAKVTIRARLGERYKLVSFDVEGLPPSLRDLTRDRGLEALGVRLGAPAVADVVIDAEKKLSEQLMSRGYPFPRVSDRRVIVDHASHKMEVTLVLDVGPQARFGDVTVNGLRRVEEGYVERRLAFARGDRFDPARIEKSRKALFDSGLFSSATFSWGEAKDVSPQGFVPITVTVVEAKEHSVGAGINYSSAEGFGGNAFWEHRNLLGGGEKLRGDVAVSQLVYTGGVSFREPDFLSPNLSLLLAAKLDADDTDAYERRALVVSGGLERRFGERVVATAGLSFEEEAVRGKNRDEDRFTLFGIPMGLRYDSSDNLLDPTRGQRTSLLVTPYFDLLGTTVDMLILRGGESFYVPLTRTRRHVWASRFTVGTIIGENRGDIPNDKRFYAGGGDSVRGYKYQYVGPLDRYDNPVGGRSLLQAGSELRFKVGQSFGVVPFVEGAAVYPTSYPDFGEDFLWAAGLGLRYFTVAGPIRFDVGFPINGRPVDDVFQIYISLGQAF